MYVPLALLVVVLLLELVTSTTRQSEIAALESLYNSTGGSAGRWNFTSMAACIKVGATNSRKLNLPGAAWNFKKNAAGYEMDPCAARSPANNNFAGINCTCSADNMCSITLVAVPCANLIGSLKPIVAALKNLPELNYLDMYKNSLKGPIPKEIGDLKKLQVLKLFVCSLTGTIPKEIGDLTQLQRLDLDENALTGTIPAEFWKLVKLETLWLSLNSLKTSIPPEISNFKELAYLYLYDNSFTGSLPSELGSTANLKYLVLFRNSLTGTIPASLGQLVKMTQLYLHGNSLTGVIPEDLMKATSLKKIFLHSNSLRGSIPPALGQLKDLQKLSLKENSLSGSIPPELGQCKKLATIDLSSNLITGTIPSNFSALSSLKELLVQENNLRSANIEANSFNFINPLVQSNLTLLNINDNNFTGTIPEVVFALPSLQTLFLGLNCFSGEIPSNICDARNLITLDLSSLSSGPSCREYIWAGTAFRDKFNSTFLATQKMQGSLPACMFQLPRLQALGANGNNLLGTLPTIISPSLYNISAARNKLTGKISSSLAMSANLSLLDLSFNRIRGDLSAFCTLESDEQFFLRKNMSLDLQVNHLSGDIPKSLHDLKTIHLLTGNVFACSANRSEIPSHTTKRDSYQCGSNDMNPMMYVYGIVLLVAAITLVCLNQFAGMRKCFVKFSSWYRIASGSKSLSIYTEGHAITCDEIETTQIVRYVRSLQVQRWFVCMMGLYLIVLTICYASLTGNHNQTVSISYAWVLTAAYLSGPNSTAVLLICGILFTCYMSYLIAVDKRSSMGHRIIDQVINVETGKKPANGAFLTNLRISVLTILRLLLIVTFNTVVIIGGNVWYVIILLSGTKLAYQKLFQFCFALFKLVWSMKAMPYMFESDAVHFGIDVNHHNALESKVFGGRHRMLFTLNAYVMFLIPLLTVLIVDDACFYNTLYPPKPVETSRLIKDCMVTYSTGTCAFTADYVSIAKTVAPFTYSYTCSDSILRIYIPLFMEIALLLIGKSTVALLYLCWVVHEENHDPHEATSGMLKNMLLHLVRSVVPHKHLILDNARRREEYSPGRVFKTRINKWITRVLPGTLTNMLVMLTFGFAAPILGAMMITYLVIDSCIQQLVFGRFLEAELSVLLEYKRQAVAVEARVGSTSAATMRARARMEDAIKDIHKPWGARAALKEAEAMCQFVPASALWHGRLSFIVITSALTASKLVDVENSSLNQNGRSMWAATTMMSCACALVLFTWIYNKFLRNKNSLARSHTLECRGSNIEMATTGAKRSTLNPLKEENHTALQPDASHYEMKEDELDLGEGAIKNPVHNTELRKNELREGSTKNSVQNTEDIISTA